MRDKIKHFASLAVGKGPAKKPVSSFFTKGKENQDDNAMHDCDEENKYPNPPFKIIILDEAGRENSTTHNTCSHGAVDSLNDNSNPVIF